jgi:diguanylate cyclase
MPLLRFPGRPVVWRRLQLFVLPGVLTLLLLAVGIWTARHLPSAPPGGLDARKMLLLVLLPLALGGCGLLALLHARARLEAEALQASYRRRLRELRRDVNRDPLTGLANRREFFDTLDEELLHVRGGEPLSLLLIDLDGFKQVNDGYGHDAGDALLVEIGRRFRSASGEKAVLGRLGGDEFGVILLGAGGSTRAGALADRLIQTATAPVTVSGRAIHVGASVGIGLSPDHGTSRVELMRRADAALYRAKARGRGGAVLFDAEMEVDHNHRRFMERELKAAILCGEVEPHYQGIYAAGDGRCIGGEALVRWRHPVRGYIPPSEFIPIAEKADLIHELGTLVLRRACFDAAGWRDGTVSVNLSPLQVMRGDIVKVVADALQDSGLDPCRLVLEITESAFLEEGERALATLQRLKSLGVGIALDDFGTGYSSLGYLQRFPFDKLKIDRSFIAGLSSSPDAATIIHAIIHLGRGLRLTVTVEGVETAEQHRFLLAAGCHELQGYHFARAEPAQRFALRLADRPRQAA